MLAEYVSTETREKLKRIAAQNLQKKTEGKVALIKKRIRENRGAAAFPSSFCSDQEFKVLQEIFEVHQRQDLTLVFKEIKIGGVK